MGKKKKTPIPPVEETAPVATEVEFEQAPLTASCRYNGGVVTTIYANGTEYTLYPGKATSLPVCGAVNSLIKQKLLVPQAAGAGEE